jgi:hypothetical protein
MRWEWLTAARVLDVQSGRVVSPGVVVVKGDRIVDVPQRVPMMSNEVGKVINLGDVTLMPGMIDAHVHLFLHPGAEDLQTVEESVPQRVLIAAAAATASADCSGCGEEGSDGGVYCGARHGERGCGMCGCRGAECYQQRVDSGAADADELQCGGPDGWA